MSRPRRILVWSLGLLLAAACVFWALYIPYRPAQLYRAIPAQATVVSAHHDLAGRWDELVENPVMLGLVSALGLEAEEARALGKNPQFRAWLDRLASDEVVFAYVPAVAPDYEPVWMFASWLGGQSQRLRWMLKGAKTPGLRHAYYQAGHRVWSLDPSLTGTGQRISFALVEGMVVGVIAPRAAALSEILAAYDGTYPSLGRRRDLHLGMGAQRSAPDRGWCKVQSAGGGIYNAPRVVYELNEMGTDSLQATLRLPWSVPAGAAPASLDAAGAQRLLGDWPLAYVAIQREAALACLQAWSPTGFFEAARAPATSLVRDNLLLCLLAEEMSGRMKGLKIPTLMVGTSVSNEAEALQGVAAALDTLNARARWGLVPQAIPGTSLPVFSVEGTGVTPYALFRRDEQVAYTAGHGWLLFSSNLQGLTNLLGRTAAAPRPWVLHEEHAQAVASGHWNLVQGAKALRVALTAWSFKLALTDSKGTQGQRQWISQAKAWIDSLAPLRDLRFAVFADGRETVVKLAAGEGEP